MNWTWLDEACPSGTLGSKVDRHVEVVFGEQHRRYRGYKRRIRRKMLYVRTYAAVISIRVFVVVF